MDPTKMYNLAISLIYGLYPCSHFKVRTRVMINMTANKNQLKRLELLIILPSKRFEIAMA
jgi:hypothetical protein